MYYKKHIFFCTNKKSNQNGCGDITAETGFEITKEYLKTHDLWGAGKIRASKSGCLGRCEDASVCVIYPEGIWYSYIDEADIHDIIKTHLIGDKVVNRLLITS